MRLKPRSTPAAAAATLAATRPPLRAGARLRRLALPLLMALVCLAGAAYAVTTPIFEISDEVWHYPLVKRLADGQGLPVQDAGNPGPWRQEGSQPPLYYALMALATRWIDTSDLPAVRWINPHADNGVITADGNNNIIIHTPREAWPWRGTVLAVRLIRLLSVLLGVATVYFTYRLAREAVPTREEVALAAAALVGFTPMFLFISASVNNDNLAITLSAAAVWLMARWLRRGGPPPAAEAALMGLLAGGAALSKVSALGLWPLAGAAMVGAAWSRAAPAPAGDPILRDDGTHPPVRPSSSALRLFSLLRGLAIMFAVALLVSGWWFWRNYRLYGDWLGWTAFLDLVGRRPHPATLAQLWGERVGFVQAYWGLFGGVSLPMPAWTYWVLNALAGLAAVGLAWAALQALRRRRIPFTSVLLGALLLGWIGLIFLGLIRWTSLTWASQGRLVFPAISAIGVLAAYGLARLWRGLPWLAASFMGALALAVPFTVIAPHYRPPPELTGEQIAAIPSRLNGGAGIDFGGEMRLLGYALETPSAMPGEAVRLTLYWQALIAMDRNWSVFLHVVDEYGVIAAQRDRYPGQGALATTLLRPGQTFADEIVIPVPEVAYAPAEAHIEVGLYDLQDGYRMPVAEGDSLVLAPIAIAARPAVSARGLGEIPNPFRQNFGNQIELVGYAMDRRQLRPGESLQLTLYWRAIGDIPLNYSVFTHVRGTGETLWAGEDAWPQKGAAPTSAWRPGELIADSYALRLKPDTPPGQYNVEVGLYDGTGQRLQAIADDGRPTDDDYVFLSPIRVVP